MKIYCNIRIGLLALLIITGSQTVLAQQAVSTSYSEDTATLDNIISALYQVISGEKGVERDWERFLYLFQEDALLMPSGKDEQGKITIRHMTPKEYAENAGQYLVKNGFFENEINRKSEHFGSLTHVWSTYESRRSENDPDPFARGINSIQLMNDGSRWWIINIYWTAENPDNPIPEKYLPN